MKKKLFSGWIAALTVFALVGASSLPAQNAPADDSTLLSQPDLEQLVAPIALYPDPLIALILPASTVPTDVVLANRYVQGGGDPNAIDAQNWDDSIKGLARYPDALQMMDDNLDWTNQLGAAVLAQQSDVMAAIQSQRAKAQALGNLQSTPQQQVIDDQQTIQIVPADPDLIYVPVYDPQVVYVDRFQGSPFISFGIGFTIGAWLSGGFDWHHHSMYSHGYYRPGYGWGNNGNNHNNVWRPNPNKPRPRPPYRPNRPGNGGGGNGHLPGWHRPPSGGNKPGIIKPPANGNRPGGPGDRPGNGNRPDKAKPGHNGAGGHVPGKTKPAPATTSPKPGLNRPAHEKSPAAGTRPAHHSKPENKLPTKARPEAQRPSQPKHVSKPAPRPAVEHAKPSAPRQPTHQQKPSPKSAAPAHRPAAPSAAPKKAHQK